MSRNYSRNYHAKFTQHGHPFPPPEVTPAHSEMLRQLAVRLLWGTRVVTILVGVATAAMGLAQYLV
jgi:hypothetical protein